MYVVTLSQFSNGQNFKKILSTNCHTSVSTKFPLKNMIFTSAGGFSFAEHWFFRSRLFGPIILFLPWLCRVVWQDPVAWCFLVLDLHESILVVWALVKLSRPDAWWAGCIWGAKAETCFTWENHRGFAPTSQKQDRCGFYEWNTHRLVQSYIRQHFLATNEIGC